MKGKKGQIFIFIIISLIFIVGIAIVFFLYNPIEFSIVDHENPHAFIESCVRDATEEAISLLSPRGGDISPKSYISYDGEEISFLCYIDQFYYPCINQRPLLIEHIEKEITNYITPIVNECFFDLRENLKSRYDIEESEMKVVTRLQKGFIRVSIDKNFKLTRKGETRDFNEFKMVMVSPLYEFSKIAMNVVNQEITFCNFDELGHNIIHQRYDVRKFITGESNIIYSIEELSSGEEFTFAVRSCRLPPGH